MANYQHTAMIQDFSKGYTGKATSGKVSHELNQTGIELVYHSARYPNNGKKSKAQREIKRKYVFTHI